MMAPMKFTFVRQEVKVSGISSVLSTTAGLAAGVGGAGRVRIRASILLNDRVGRRKRTRSTEDTHIPIVGTHSADPEDGIDASGTCTVIPEDVVEEQGVAEGRRTARQGSLQLGTVLSGRKTCRGRLTIAGDGRRGRDVLHDRVVVEAHVGRIVERNTAAFVRGDVVDDHVVVDVHREVARHQEAQTAAVIVRQVGLDQVVVDIHRAGALWTVGRAIIRGRVGRQFASDHDTGAFIVGTVEVDAVVVDRLPLRGHCCDQSD